MGYFGDSEEATSRRIRLSGDEIGTSDEWLRSIFDLWHSIDRGGLLPSRDDFDPVILMRMARGRAHIVDTSSPDPEDYRFRLWGTVNSYDGEHTSKRLGDMPDGPMKDAAKDDYWEVVISGCPSYHLVRHVQDGVVYSYSRLILPTASNGRQVNQLLVFINERQIAEFDDVTPYARLPANPYHAISSPAPMAGTATSGIKRFFDA